MRIHILFLCFFILLPMACVELDEASIDQPQRSIIGGTETNYDDWQGVIGLMYCPSRKCESFCSGTLIDPQVVLTAGHCVYYADDGFDTIDKPKDLYVVGGPTMDIWYTNGAEIITHPNWAGYPSFPDSLDMAMVKLESPITGVETHGITKQAPYVGLSGKIVGYGISDASDPGTAGTHRVGDTTVQWFLQDTIFELGSPTSICSGDSGGPFLVEQDGAYNVMGVASFGLEGACSADHDGFFFNTYLVRQWINDTMIDMVGHGIDMGGEPDTGTDPEPDAGTDPDSGPNVGIDPGTDPESDVDSGPSNTDSAPGAAAGGGDFPSDGVVIPRSGRSSGCQLAPKPSTGSLIERILLMLF